MANVISAVARFYPVNGKLDANLFISLYSDIQGIFWRSYYFFNIIDNCIEILYPCKRPVRKELYNNDEILKHYHIWLRISDFSGYPDFIGFKSNTFKSEYFNLESHGKYLFFNESWNYASSCLYKADELELRFNSPNAEYLNKLIKDDGYRKLSRELAVDLTWNHKMTLIYTKTSQIEFENDYTRTHIEENFYQNHLAWNDSSDIRGLFTDDYRIMLQEFFDSFSEYDENHNQIRIDNSIDQLSFKYKGTYVQKFEWTNNMDFNLLEWEGSTMCDWTNCIDPLFVEFKTWFKRTN